MGRVVHVSLDDLGDPRLDPYRNQRDAWLRAPHHPSVSGSDPGAGPGSTPPPLFMAEGILVVRALLASEYRVQSILGTPERVALIESDVTARASRQDDDLTIFLAPRRTLEAIVGFDLHRGLLAAGVRGRPHTPDDVIRHSSLLVIAEDLSNHDNLGGLLRTTAALGGGVSRTAGLPRVGVLLSPRCCDPLYRKALRVSMGHALALPWATLPDWPAGLRSVAEAGYRLVGLLTPHHWGESHAEPRPLDPDAAAAISEGHRRAAVVVGTEGSGLSDAAIASLGALDGRALSIPMSAGVDSLNVVVALGIALDRLRGR